MSIRRLICLPAAATLAVLTCGEAAHADLLIEIDKTAQRMTVTVDGHEVYKWTVATGGIDYDTPNGVFKPFRMEIDHHSDEWDNAPMPYSIFFTQTGNAVHGTYEQRSLGVWSRPLMGHSYRVIRRMRYGTDSTRERHNDRGGPSSDTT